MTKNVHTLLAAALLGATLLAPPRAYAEQTLMLDDLIAEAKRQNPELLAARDRALAMASVPQQVSALDDPTLSWEAWNIPDSLRVDRADNNIFRVAQKLPFPGKRRLAGDVAAYEAEREAHDATSVEVALVAAVKGAYATLWEAHERLQILRRDQELAQRFARVAEQRYATGGATQADLLRAQGEVSHVANDLALEPLAIESATAELNSLLGRGPDAPLGEPAPLPVPRLDVTPQVLAELALDNRPDLAAQQATIAREESAEELAHRSYYPDFEVSVGRFVNYGSSDGFGAMASVTLPLANLGKYDAGVAEARARVSSAHAERKRLEVKVRREVQQAYLKARAALLRYELLVTTHVPQSDQAMRVAEGAYQAGTLGFLEVVDSLRRLNAVHLEHATAQADFERARAELERVVGEELPRAASAPGAPAAAKRRG
jgi:cobalt-zinc-cadmium efflux system outer membrane protein